MPEAPTQPIVQKKKHHGCCLGCLLAAVILFALFAVTAIGLFFAYRGGYINQVQILNAVGQGYGEVSIVNIMDDAVTAQITPLDTDPADLQESYLSIDPTGISAFRALQRGRYTLDLSDSNGALIGNCTLQIVSGDVYQFVAVPGGVAVTRDSSKTATTQELNINTSSLCQQ